ncbi:MAG TPA: hypothetical protein VKU41_17055 [Polyangiaceae bacterium]|nr:hypothetical protein [Polyangiaceae bacterium]
MDLNAKGATSAADSAGGKRRDVLLVAAVALAARLAVVAWARTRFPAVEDGHYYDLLARRLANGQGYTWLWPDGAVTYAALYPVGYPALVAIAYATLGVSTGAAMGVNALLGTLSAVAAHSLVDSPETPRWRPLAAGLAVALHPALVPYTAALMTEGVTASLLVIGAAAANRARTAGRKAPLWIAASGAVVGVATLVRPQSLFLAPVLGVLAADARADWVTRLRRALGAVAVALACVMPWTARNCLRMDRCALVSVNGGWNLLIGAQTDSGWWQRIETPAECATVWSEAGKDACFERAAWRAIAHAPVRWVGRMPAKVAVTFDYFGAAPWYLHVSNPDAVGPVAKIALGAVETVACRLLLLGALFACAAMSGLRRGLRAGIALAGGLAALTVHGSLGYVALAGCVGAAGPRAVVRGPVLAGVTAALVALTAVVHAVFFGAGRYGLVVAPLVAALAFVSSRARG